MADTPPIATPPIAAPPMAAGGTQPPIATPPIAAPPNVSTPPPPQMAEGGKTGGGGWKSFFDDINVVDVAVSAFIIGGVLYATSYFKFMMSIEKSGYADLSTRVMKLESAQQAAKKVAEANAAGNMGNGKRRPMMRM